MDSEYCSSCWWVSSATLPNTRTNFPGNPPLNTIDNRRTAEGVHLNQEGDYNSNFPNITNNLNWNNSKPAFGNIYQVVGNTNNFSKQDENQEHAPYTVIKTYVDRLHYNQSKSVVSVKFSEPEITTKQGLHDVLFVKNEVISDLAAACKFTPIGKFCIQFLHLN